MAGQRPEAAVSVLGSGDRLRVPADRLIPAQPGELFEREMIGQQIGVGQVEVGVDRRRGHETTVGFETDWCQLR